MKLKIVVQEKENLNGILGIYKSIVKLNNKE